MEIPLPHSHTLTLPDNYKKIPLPGLTEWIHALRTRKDRGETRLCSEDGYCCLGVLSELQGRLTPEGTDGCDKDSGRFNLSAGNPVFPILNRLGWFPAGVMVGASLSLSGVNDYHEPSEGWEIIPVILENLYYDPQNETNQPAK